MTKAELMDIGKSLTTIDQEAMECIRRNWDSIAKPIDGLGLYESIICRIGGIQGTSDPKVEKRSLILFFSDNGIAENGVSQSDVSVTRKVAIVTAKKESTAYLMARKANIDVVPIDIGMKGAIVSGIENRRISDGTKSFLCGDAMTIDQTLKAIDVGYSIVSELKKKDLDLVLLGEMGVANTTTATAVGCALLGKDPLQYTGHGAGLSDEAMRHKAKVIADGIRFHGFNSSKANDPLEVLSALGGYDIAAMVGSILACAVLHVPAILDGIVTYAAALVAATMFPAVKEVMIASHRPKEPMGRLMMESLGLRAPIDADLALGEGTGAILLVPQIDVSIELYRKGISFENLGMESYRRY
ncbi:MAG: nicotinate-nucleotide--dimethylbenzimidazole phosphoribosyltransferase [Spirochaetales bacterium]|nr:nicotinate-nucleotide--dimethylbenzimidazole phosphoribosyltransferase [Spirochaetales bacterium]